MLLCTQALVKFSQNVKTTLNGAASATIYLKHSQQQPRHTIALNRLVSSLSIAAQGPRNSFILGRKSKTFPFRSPAQFRSSSAQAQPHQTNIEVPVPPSDPNAAHTTLESFLDYTARSNLSPTSTTYLGTRYEYLTQKHLHEHLGFTLTRVGGRGDSGIDHLGTWALPAVIQAQAQSPSQSQPSSASPPIRVVVQCKRLTRAAGPNLIRELEGSFRGAPSVWRGETALGVMVCTRPATKGVRDTMGRSSRGLVWITLEEVADEAETKVKSADDKVGVKQTRSHSQIDQEAKNQEEHTSIEDEYTGDRLANNEVPVPATRMRQFLYNAAAASKCGLEGVSVGLRYDVSGLEQEAQLLWQGMPIDFAARKS